MRPYPRYQRRIGPHRGRTGQGMIEVAVGFLVFLMALFLVVDIGWVMFHQVVIAQGAKNTSRYAGTNLHTRAEIRNHFYTSLGPSVVSSTVGSTVTITTVPLDMDFASVEEPTGLPSVTVDITYSHRVLGPWPFTNMNLRATATSQISTWPNRWRVWF